MALTTLRWKFPEGWLIRMTPLLSMPRVGKCRKKPATTLMMSFRLARFTQIPAIQENRCHTFLARNVEKRLTPILIRLKRPRLFLFPYRQIPDLVRQGDITHALVVTAFYWYDLLRQAK